MINVWPRCYDDLFRVRMVSEGGHMPLLYAKFLLCSTYVLTALPHVQKVVNFGNSVHIPFLPLFLHFRVGSSVHWIQSWVIACQNLVTGSRKFLYNDFCARYLACDFDCLQLITSRTREIFDSTLKPCGVRSYFARHILEINVLRLGFLLLVLPVRTIWYQIFAANLHWVAVVIIEIWINLPPVLWCFRR